ncbi:MAG TPA: aminomethyl-transferring glycine dehydrogenase subunit GcvPA [Anaerolineae bacterium]|nr:aminomethyl-transferring glycine dehydrogenase subunit GcvPA [Anaerolineae bacterium]
MTYIPHTDADRTAMLEAIGVTQLEDLFGDVPERARFPKLDLPAASTEMEAWWEMQGLSEANADVNHYACFLGAGVYNHYSPHTVDYVLRRGEFYTAYTPYQPEISQGTLQAMFEYQSMICQLTGMEVSNASHYDGATSLAEGVLLALNAVKGNRRKVIVSPALNPQYRQVVRTYLQGTGVSVVGDENLMAEISDLKTLLDDQTAALIIQNPNFLGQFEDVAGLADAVHAAGALFVVVPDPISLGLFRPPGAYGADVVAAEGQCLGIPLSFGGPYLGIFATKNAYVRKMAGRLVGETLDVDGNRGYVLTLSTREQHIRREKATSNICTNVGLIALAASVYLATMGRCGLEQVARLCYHKAHYAAGQIDKLRGYRVNPQAGKPFFKEFVVKCPRPVGEINDVLFDEFDMIGGYDLGRDYPHLKNHMLIAVTETNTRQEIDDLVEGLRQAAEA